MTHLEDAPGLVEFPVGLYGVDAVEVDGGGGGRAEMDGDGGAQDARVMHVEAVVDDGTLHHARVDDVELEDVVANGVELGFHRRLRTSRPPALHGGFVTRRRERHKARVQLGGEALRVLLARRDDLRRRQLPCFCDGLRLLTRPTLATTHLLPLPLGS